MRRLSLIAATVLAGAALAATTAQSDDTRTYWIELDNAFGIVTGSEVKVAGVTQGTVKELDINSRKKAVIKAELSGPVAELGEDTICSSEPQSLIAEYFLDCEPHGAALAEDGGPEDPDIPVEQTRQTVQTDLVNNALREPFKRRLQLILNEFGTALAGNPESLNSAIRRGAPALLELRKVLRILGDQNTIIRQLNVDSDEIMAQLAERREDIVRFVRNAEATAAASAERRDDLSRDFEILDDFLAELRPTLARLRGLAVEQTPLLADLRDAAPGLNRLALNLPDFNEASTVSLDSLGKAGVVGRRALRKGKDELRQLVRTGRNAPRASELLKDFVRDLDDPRRAVEVDARAAERTGRKAPTGYTGLEGLLNYVYYQPGALNQFDQETHLLHFSIFEFESGPCGHYETGYNEEGEVAVPGADGEEFHPRNNEADFQRLHRCVSWLGPNQPGLTQDVNLPRWDGSVCPDGSDAPELCEPGVSSQGKVVRNSTAGSVDPAALFPGLVPDRDGGSGAGDSGGGDSGGAGGGDSGPQSEPAAPSGPNPPGGLDDLLDLPGADGVKSPGADGLNGLGLKRDRRATRNLIDFLFEN